MSAVCSDKPPLDLVASVQRFQHRMADLPQLLFVTDEEVLSLMGDDACGIIAGLDRLGAEARLCATCGGVCCSDVACELYAAQFGRCPVHRFRPLACRFHFCHRFGSTHKAQIVALRDLYLACYMLRDTGDNFKLRCLDAPPLAELCPEFVAGARPLVDGVVRGVLNTAVAAQHLKQMVKRLRTSGWSVSAS